MYLGSKVFLKCLVVCHESAFHTLISSCVSGLWSLCLWKEIPMYLVPNYLLLVCHTNFKFQPTTDVLTIDALNFFCEGICCEVYNPDVDSTEELVSFLRLLAT
jgi:hypothetical protein